MNNSIIINTEEVDKLRDKNKLLADALKTLVDGARKYIDGDKAFPEHELSWAKAVLNNNAIILIDFPEYLKKNFSAIDMLTVKEVIENYNDWNQ